MVFQHFVSESKKGGSVRKVLPNISKRKYKHISWTAVPCAVVMSSRTWWTPTTTSETASSAWGRPILRRMPRTASVCAFLTTGTLTYSLQFFRKPWFGPSGTKQYLTNGTCSTEPKSTLRWVKRLHLKKRPSAAYISWSTTTTKILKAACTQRSYTKLYKTIIESRKCCRSALYLTALKKYLFSGKIGQAFTIRK